MLDILLNYSSYIVNVFEVAACLLGLVRYRRLLPSLRWLAILASFDTAAELTLLALVRIFHFRNNLFMAPFIAAGEVILLTLLYRQILQSAAFNKVVPWLLSLFCLYALLNSPLFYTTTGYIVSLEVITALVEICLAGLYFQKLLNELQIKYLYRDPFFWLSVALIVYGLGSLLISLFSNYLLTHCTVQLQKIVFWGLRSVFNIQLYLTYILVLWARPAPANADHTYSA